MEDLKYEIWLSHLYDIGIRGIHKLLKSFETPKDIYFAKEKFLNSTEFLQKRILDRVQSIRKNVDLNKTIEYMEENQIDFISSNNHRYPAELKNIPDYPYGLFVKGNLEDSLGINIGMVGTRKCSDYGGRASYDLSKDIASQGATVISGLALGIDRNAHLGALESNGKTIAVVACGVDICYPQNNMEIYEEIIKKHAVISEYPPKTTANPWFFPMRNRIISGLSQAVVVVEAPIKSGALITANLALDQGKEVFAVPGNIDSKLSAGTNMLIREGAHVATCAADIFDGLGMIKTQQAHNSTYPTENINKMNKSNINLAPQEKLVYDCIGLKDATLEEVLIKTGMKIQNAQYILTNLEFDGLIKKLPGQRYTLT